MIKEILNRIQVYLRAEEDLLVPVQKIWREVLSKEEQQRFTLEDLVKYLREDKRFNVVPKPLEEKMIEEVMADEAVTDEDHTESFRHFTGPTVWLADRKPTKAELSKIILNKSQAAIDALVEAWDYRDPESEDQLLELMQAMKKFHNNLKEILSTENQKQ